MFDECVIDQEQIVTGAKAPSRRAWTVWLAVTGVLAIVLATSWLYTPHLASDQVPESVGVVPQGNDITLPSGVAADPSGDSAWTEASVQVRNTGLLPVTVSQPRPAEVSGTGTTHRVDLALSRSLSTPHQGQMKLGRGEQAVVVVRIHAPECSDTGGSESLTTVKDLILRAQVGPIAHDARVSAWRTLRVATEDGSALPNCP